MAEVATPGAAVPKPVHVPDSAAFDYLDPDHPPKFHGGNVIGIDTLTLVWDA